MQQINIRLNDKTFPTQEKKNPPFPTEGERTSQNYGAYKCKMNL